MQLWGAAFGSNFGEQLFGLALENNFGEPFWGTDLKNSRFEAFVLQRQSGEEFWEIASGTALGSSFDQLSRIILPNSCFENQQHWKIKNDIEIYIARLPNPPQPTFDRRKFRSQISDCQGGNDRHREKFKMKHGRDYGLFIFSTNGVEKVLG